MQRTFLSKLRGKKAFTLVELLIVIAIIAVLTAAFLPTLRGGTTKARDAAKKSLLTDISVVLENMINDGTSLPDNGVDADNKDSKVGFKKQGTGLGDCLKNFTQAEAAKIRDKLGRTPQAFPSVGGGGDDHLCSEDAGDKGTYVWYNKVSNSNFILAVEMENLDNANVDHTQTASTILGWTDAQSALSWTVSKRKEGGKGFFYVIARQP